MTRAGARFSRVEPRRRARAFVLGLLAELPRKNCWTIAEHSGDRTPEENFQAGKGLTGLDEHQVRRWTSWYRWVTLAMLGAAVLTIAAAIESARGPDAAGQIPLTRNEIAHLLATVTAPPGRDAGHRLRWSHWRRRHQHRARTCHYQRQITQDHAT
jgi:hypothetical protein